MRKRLIAALRRGGSEFGGGLPRTSTSHAKHAKGSRQKPLPVTLDFGYTVGDPRARPTSRVPDRAEGLITTEAFVKFSQAGPGRGKKAVGGSQRGGGHRPFGKLVQPEADAVQHRRGKNGAGDR